ncbi:hypothetical protein [Microlunatus sp. Gsoil 973]|uniref:hypothetical protein n=1 Tax=Microlunatus sp. Gsoil 973 TaxID=2672569 RepID=UPI0012B4B211|nr:hypothetical protein [Microlunatus sp. Gsoil 973]QGN33023.1 hypothetical protein GJV80_09590 [Microlunatus sp. Gsoil 973]
MSSITTRATVSDVPISPPSSSPASSAPPLLEQLSDAIHDYPKSYLTVDIYSVNPVASDGDVINTGDEVTFRIRVNNTGPLAIDNLKLLVEAEAGATGVKKHGASTFQSNVTTAPISVPANQFESSWTELPDDYHFIAGPATTEKVDLVKVLLWDWDGNLSWMLTTHTGRSDETEDVYSHKVLGT